MSTHEESPKPAPEGRDSNGRFAKGNEGGPGNPFARRVAQMRSLALEAVTDDDLTAIFGKLVELAKGGDVAAAKLVLQYTLGKPVEMPHPDRIDRDEIEAFRENALREGDQPVLLSTPLEPALLAARELGPLNARRFAHGLADGLRRQAEDQASATVSKRGKRPQTKPVNADPSAALPETETIRLVNEADAGGAPKGRAANDRRP